MNHLPAIVSKLCYAHEAWIVGSAALDINNANDYDVLVSFAHWKDAAMLIPEEARPNSFGGWKFTNDGATIDVWPGDLVWFLTNNIVQAIWHPRSGSRFRRINK
jgi:hypothetical protein